MRVIRYGGNAMTQKKSLRGLLLAAGLFMSAGNTPYAQVVEKVDLINLSVGKPGIYRVTHDDLLAAGLDLTGVRHGKLAVVSRGVQVPIRVKGQDQSAGSKKEFGPGAFIEFVGEGVDTLYTDTNIYTLRVDRTQKARVSTDKQRVSAAPPAAFYMETRDVEEQALYSFSTPNGDPWYAARMLAWGRALSRDFDFAVDHHVAGAAPVTLTVDAYGVTDWPAAPDHHMQLDVNGFNVADEEFDGFVEASVQATLPTGVLNEGANTLTVTLPLDQGVEFDLINLDRYRVTYPRSFVAQDGALTFTAAGPAFQVDGLPNKNAVVYRIRENGDVERVTKLANGGPAGNRFVKFNGTPEPATYYVSTVAALRAPELSAPQAETDITGGEAEYLIISHPDFIGPELDALVQARQGQFSSVLVVDVEDIYAQFSHYVVDAQAIRDYIRHAHRNMGTEFVLLVGGDTYDYRDFLGVGSISFIPSLYAQTDSIVQFAPVDPLYADTDGDEVPDLAVGRFPVRTSAELATLVAQTLAYETKSYGQTALFAADDFDGNQNYAFTEDSEALIGRLPSGWQVTRAYIDGPQGLGLAGARDTLIDAINNGVALTSYFGHSGPGEWTFEGLFTGADAQDLTNQGQPTVVTQWGCWNTYYVAPTEDTLGHELMLNGDRGAATVLGASTLTGALSERALSSALYARLTEPGKPLGTAILEAKRALAESHPNQLKDVILGWTQLGDPALVIQN